MDIGQVLVVLLYLWLLVALGVYAWRGYRRVIHHETRQDRAARRAAAQGGDLSTPAGSPSARNEGDLVHRAIRDELEQRRVAEAAGPLTEPGTDQAPLSPTGAAPRATVAEAVEGIRLPGGLVPLITSEELDPNRARFTTTTSDADEVRDALAEELTRLGFSVTRATSAELVATRDQIRLGVQIQRDAGTPDDEGRVRFPTVSSNAVVVVLSS